MGKYRKRYNKYLKKYFGYNELKELQFKIIYFLLHRNKDICAILATGYGKSICYQLPFLLTKKCVIVISPLISLMEDQMSTLKELNINVCCLNSNNNNKNQEKVNILHGESKIIYITPEYLLNCQQFIKKLADNDNLCCFAIDESHCISSWSDNSFRPEYQNLNCLRDWAPKTPILTLTATANDKVINDIETYLQLKKTKIIKSSFDRPNLFLSVSKKTKDNIELDLKPLVTKYKEESIIIYTRTRKDTEKISGVINHLGIRCLPYHAGLDNQLRHTTQDKFMKGKVKCIVATIAFGMGINNKHVRLVIQYGCSSNLTAYYQEIGRAGRDGEKSHCHLFYSSNDFRLNRYFMSNIEDIERREYEEKQIIQMEKYLLTHMCRRKFILKYFGEEYNVKCNNCDNCKNSHNLKVMDLSNQSKLILELVGKLKVKRGCTTLVQILRGSKAKKIKPFFKFKEYNKGSNYSDKWWKEMVRILITNDVLYEKTLESGFGNVIHIGSFGEEWYQKVKNKDNLSNDDKLILPVTELLTKLEPTMNKSYDDILEEFGLVSI